MLLQKTGEVVGLADVRDKLNEELLESVVLREMGTKKKRDELNIETRKGLQQFCVKWADVLSDLDIGAVTEGKMKTTKP